QPYLGFRARVAGRITTNLTVAGELAPAPRVKLRGEALLRALDVADGRRSVLTADLVNVAGIDADWPTRVAVDRVRVRHAWARVERAARGGFLRRNLLERPEGGRPPRAPAARAASAPSAPPLEVSFREGVFEDQAATIVDAAVNPPVRLEVVGAR